MPKTRTGTKATALLVAFAVINWSADQLAAGQPTEGVLGLMIGLALVAGYQLIEETDHAQAYNDVVEAIGEDTLQALADAGADELRDALKGSGFVPLDEIGHTEDADGRPDLQDVPNSTKYPTEDDPRMN